MRTGEQEIFLNVIAFHDFHRTVFGQFGHHKNDLASLQTSGCFQFQSASGNERFEEIEVLLILANDVAIAYGSQN